MRPTRRLALLAAGVSVVAVASAAVAVPAAQGERSSAARGLIAPVEAELSMNASASGNWFGYNLGTRSRGERFSSIAGTWNVPRARQRTNNQAEYSSAWIGIGGGCVDTQCSRVDNTLIQVGTESNVDADGTATYGTWWELIPAPAVTAPLIVHAGDRVRAQIKQLSFGLWRISLKNLTTRDSWQITVPYYSTKATAEWIVETPLVIGTNDVGITRLPRLTKVHFDDAYVNGHKPRFKKSERVFLVPDRAIIGRPSSPQKDRDGFGACSWTTRCRVPGEF